MMDAAIASCNSDVASTTADLQSAQQLSCCSLLRVVVGGTEQPAADAEGDSGAAGPEPLAAAHRAERLRQDAGKQVARACLQPNDRHRLCDACLPTGWLCSAMH